MGRQTPRCRHGLPTNPAKPARLNPAAGVLSGSWIEIESSLIQAEEMRVREDGEARRHGSIDRRVFTDRKKHIHGFLAFLNERHGPGAVARLRLTDLTMEDVEAYSHLQTLTDESAGHRFLSMAIGDDK